MWLSRLQDEHVHFSLKKLACVTDIHCCLYFITSKDPNLNASLSNVINRLTDIFLQLVLNCSRANELKALLQLV